MFDGRAPEKRRPSRHRPMGNGQFAFLDQDIFVVLIQRSLPLAINETLMLKGSENFSPFGNQAFAGWRYVVTSIDERRKSSPLQGIVRLQIPDFLTEFVVAATCKNFKIILCRL
jgi:hypothetical protein